ncbi:uncharacterized protein LOC107611419 [Arachis ipaensis]|uniref:uncharacterized protein LOC107611419 n=1 Tax=Arachis ipaensis TaxID=130454 RepID=UPI0007AF6AFA|nr:uncharacterized protein LOC107611419 [Arachis ipaensis]
MTALENMAAAMQGTTEALGQQMNNNGNDGGGTQGLMTLATFLKAMERALLAQVVLEGQCVEFATYLLTGKASHWWQGVRRLLQQGDNYITWDTFQEEFYKKYFPTSARTAKELELLQLKQGAMSISEYRNKFEELFRVAEEYMKKAAVERGSHRGLFPQNRGKSFAPRDPPFKRGGSFKKANNNNSLERRFGK